MAISSIRFCLSTVFSYVIVNTLVESRSLRLRHNHHSRPNYYNTEDGDLSPRYVEDREDNSEYRDFYKQTSERHDYLEDLAHLPNLEYGNIEEREPSLHRSRHEHGSRNHVDESLRRKDEERRYNDYERFSSSELNARRKRHNNHNGVNYRKITNQDRKDIFINNQRNREQELLQVDDLPFELEVKKVQKTSLCNYTVVSIPDTDTRGSRVPKDLVHVMCNHAGSKCQGNGTYCCIQTYRNIEVFYGSTKDLMKIYVGCVCALQDPLLTESPLPDIND